jgi:hypothetical protein
LLNRETNTSHNSASSSPCSWSAPDLFVMTVALPCDAPKLGKPTVDGNGITVVAYMKMKTETRSVLEFLAKVKATQGNAGNGKSSSSSSSSTSSASDDADVASLLPTNVEHVGSLVSGVKLFDEWCERCGCSANGKGDPTYQGRIKFLPTAVNAADFGMPSYMQKYNGKPVLIKRAGITGTLTNHSKMLITDSNNVTATAMQFDINLHAFPYLAKQAFCYMKDSYYKHIVGNMACCIEGRTDDELPECLIGSFQIQYPDPKYIVSEDHFFAAPEVETEERTPESATPAAVVTPTTPAE